jgi:hypothetical protein
MPDTEFWNKEFVITSVTRADLQTHGFPDAKIALLADEDMETIASAMEDIYCDSGYWEDLELCTKRTLERKEEDAVLERDEKPTGDEGGLT